MKLKLINLLKITCLSGPLVMGLPANAHIDLISPTPILDGRAMDRTALKVAPFGAPGVDISEAPLTTLQAGSSIEIEVEVYVFHPGEIVVLYTKDREGKDVEPVTLIPFEGAEIPHHNFLARAPVRGLPASKLIKLLVPLPDLEGEIILVVRQIMHGKFDKNADGTVSLKRIYYHQAARLKPVR